MNLHKKTGFWLGIGFLLLSLFIPPAEGMHPAAVKTLGVTLLMAVWWISECVPIYITALVPVALFSLLGILDAGTTAANYGHNYVLMLLGGFFLTKSIELSGLHKRISLFIIGKTGTSRRQIILSFMIATALLSYWITNVAVALLMLPIALAIIDKEDKHNPEQNQFGLALMLSIAYAASVGGTGSLIGTPPNLVLAGVIQNSFPDIPEINFFEWMKIGTPIVLVMIPVVWLYIIRYFRISGYFSGSKELIKKETDALGPLSKMEKRVLGVFIFTAFGWIFRNNIELGSFLIPGWAPLLGLEEYVHDSTVAIMATLLLVSIPSGFSHDDAKPATLLDWKSAARVPWGVCILLGGGFALSVAFRETELVTFLGTKLSFISHYPPIIVLLAVIFFVIFLTEINSNTATTNIILPILGSMAVAASMNPLLLLIPATFACSFAFMMPSGTGTNAVIFGSNRISIPEMAKCGLGLNLLCIILLTLLMYGYILPVIE